ncbi:hypothetical protein [Streptomyces buecherae]|uniref:hypothetical protein n=1 Tax=Streptomyces buecherae TaxID=2763006 RepID=UPI003675F728
MGHLLQRGAPAGERRGGPALRRQRRRVEHREELDRIVADVFAEPEFDDAVGRLESAGIACARQRSLAEFLARPPTQSPWPMADPADIRRSGRGAEACGDRWLANPVGAGSRSR